MMKGKLRRKLVIGLTVAGMFGTGCGTGAPAILGATGIIYGLTTAAMGTGALAAALLSGVIPLVLIAGANSGNNGQPAPNPIPGPQGPEGPQGPAGDPATNLFSIFVDDFYTAIGSTTEVELVPIFTPRLGGYDPDPLLTDRVAYRVAIPANYLGSNPVVMRLFMQQDDPVLVPGPLKLRSWVKLLRNGSGTVADYTAAGGQVVTLDVATVQNEVKVIDLPLNAALPDGLGGAALQQGDFLAVELATEAPGGGLWGLLGVEFYETLPGQAPTAGNLGASIP